MSRPRPGTTQGGSFSSVVQDLVRHQFGASAMDVPATDLDQYVADMLVKEAQERKEKWKEEGMSAYLSDEEQGRPKRRPNKRFLLNTMRSVDDHNAALARQEAEEREARNPKPSSKAGVAGKRSLFAMAKDSMGSASRPRPSESKATSRNDNYNVSEGSRERSRRDYEDDHHSSRYSSRRDRSPSTEDYRSKRSHTNQDREKQDYRSERSQSRRDRAASVSSREDDYSDVSERKRSKRLASPSYDFGEVDSKQSSRRHHSPSHRERDSRRDRPDRERSSKRNGDSDEDGAASYRRRERDHRHRERPQDERSSSRRHKHRDDSIERDRDRREEDSSRRKRRRKASEDHDSDDRTERRKHRSSKTSLSPEDRDRSKYKARRNRSPTPDELPPDVPSASMSTAHAGPSKMDKYFKPDYDPRLDVSMDSLTDPNTGLISEGNFDEWSNMLEILKIRRQEKNYLAAEREEQAREAKYKAKDSSKKSKSSSSSKMPTTFEESNKAILGIGGYAKNKKSTEWGAGPDLSF